MKITPFALIFSIAISTPAFAKEGGNVGNGGGGLICSDGKVYLYDLFEATLPGEQSDSGLIINRRDDNWATQLHKALQRIGAGFSKELQSELETRLEAAKAIVRGAPIGVEIVPPTDVNGEFMMKGCRLSGVASYNDEKNRLVFDMDLYYKMPDTDQAALWLHEIVYKYLRDVEGATDSRKARRIVGLVFSDTDTSDYAKFFPLNLKLVSEVKTEGGGTYAEITMKNAISKGALTKARNGCGRSTTDIRYVESTPEVENYFVSEQIHVLRVPDAPKPYENYFLYIRARQYGEDRCAPTLEYYDYLLRRVASSTFEQVSRINPREVTFRTAVKFVGASL